MSDVILGQRYRDTVTGFTGEATAVTIYLYGTDRAQITAYHLKDGRVVEEWFDERRLEPAADTTTPPPVPDDKPYAIK